jgi:hypothetical protein
LRTAPQIADSARHRAETGILTVGDPAALSRTRTPARPHYSQGLCCERSGSNSLLVFGLASSTATTLFR